LQPSVLVPSLSGVHMTSDRDPRGLPGLQSVDRAVRIIEALAAGPATLSTIAATTGLSDATAMRYLGGLVSHGLVERDQVTRRYRIGMRMFVLGRSALGGRDFMTMATSVMTRLVEEFDETINLGARAGDDLVIVHAFESSQQIRKGASVGEKDNWHSSGLGKAILSTLPDAEVERLLDQQRMVQLTARTLTTVEDLRRDLERIRERGFGVDDEESAEGLRCVAVPIRDASGTARYAISVSGPSYRLPHARLHEIGSTIRDQTRVLTALLDGDPSGDRSKEDRNGASQLRRES
jgi:DNA-binding IclR family transcriptional regulator